MRVNNERIREIAHEWAKNHNPELLEGCAEAYEAGVLDAINALAPVLSKIKIRLHFAERQANNWIKSILTKFKPRV